jgi:serine/threonine-protein kinase
MHEERLGRYRLLTLLATGGMGEVYLARQDGPAGFSKKVVIKRILRHLAKDQSFIDLFLNEARLAAVLQHPHIAQVFGLEREGDSWFIAMEWVQGRSLRALIEQAKRLGKPLPPAVVARLCAQALQGLAYAHALKDDHGRPLGIVHRDVTPENIHVASSGVAKLLDFGIAKAMGRAGARVGTPKGKVAYMPPELTVAGAVIDGRADVYSVGVVLFEALTLARPANVPVSAQELERPRAPYASEPSLPQALDAIIARALELDPAKRWPSAEAMGEALEGWLTSTGQTVMPGDVRRLLVELFGPEPETDSSVPVVGEEPLPGGGPTGQLGAARVSGPSLSPVRGTGPGVTLEEADATSEWRRVLIGGAVVGLIGVGVAVGLIAGRHAAEEAPALSAEELQNEGVLFPEIVLDGSDEVDAGPAATHRPVARPHAVAGKAAVRTGKLAVRVNPWAEVWLGKRKLGVTPLAPLDLPAGLVTVTLKNPELKAVRSERVRVPPGGEAMLKVDLLDGQR